MPEISRDAFECLYQNPNVTQEEYRFRRVSSSSESFDQLSSSNAIYENGTGISNGSTSPPSNDEMDNSNLQIPHFSLFHHDDYHDGIDDCNNDGTSADGIYGYKRQFSHRYVI